MTLKINGKRFNFFNQFSVALKYDTVASAFGFSCYYDSNNSEHRELLKPLHYQKAIIEHNGETLITGTILSNTFKDAPQKQLATISGYSLPGVLEDCEIQGALQSDGLTLKEIAEKICAPFNISVVISDSVSEKMNSTFDVTNAKETQTCKGYLTELAAQKNIILSHTSGGALLFTEAKVDQKPIHHFERGIPGTEFSLQINGQALHSEITAMKEADTEGGNAGDATVKNPFVTLFRPKIVVQSSGTDIDSEQAAKNVRAEELKNIKLTITTDRWEIDGKIIKPNQIISVHNHEIFVWQKTNWFIESVKLDGDKDKTVATLECVLPECFNGGEPQNIFSSNIYK